MATFKILEDNMKKIKLEKIEAFIPERPTFVQGKKRDTNNRNALQPISNQIQQNNKRPKLCDGNKPAADKKKIIKIEKKIAMQKETKVGSHHVAVVDARPNNLKKHHHSIVDDLEFHAEYLRSIWSYLINMERNFKWPIANYMTKQPHLTQSMRCVVVDWLAAVADEYSLSEQTLHLSVNYIDRFLSQMSVVRDKFQLLGSAAMMIAGKIEDVYPPDSKEWAYLTGNSYTSQQIRKMEQLLLKVLKFELQPPTILSFIQHLCAEHKIDKKTMHLAMYLSELILLEGEDYLHHVPSKLGAASIALARLTLNKMDPWPRILEATSGYSLKQLSPVVQRQNRTFQDSPTKTQTAIQTKYQTEKYYKVALLKPRSLNLDEIDDAE